MLVSAEAAETKAIPTAIKEVIRQAITTTVSDREITEMQAGILTISQITGARLIIGMQTDVLVVAVPMELIMGTDKIMQIVVRINNV